ncbi:hypothetical protein ACUNV4_10385 [Granulosicoccus sp. 3-233]|uniref:hypothetical protein n=1 Tax=Granulosicoccus sp. 3-233 TaxID=3417969 RepID=UPI003D3373D8
MRPDHIGSVGEYLQPIRPLTHHEVTDVSIDLAQRIKATVLLLTCSDGGDLLELNHKDLMTVLYGLLSDSEALCKLLDTKPDTDDTAASGEVQEIISLNAIASSQVQALMSYVENEKGRRSESIRADLQRLRGSIVAIDDAALKSWQQCKYFTASDQPEQYLLQPLSEFEGMPYDLLNTMTARALACIDVLNLSALAALESTTIHTLLWDVSSQLDMINTVLSKVKTPEAMQ